MPTDGTPYWLGHRARLRDKARREGIEGLRPHEVVELILYQSDLRGDMTDLAHALLERFGSIDGILLANRRELTAVPGMSCPTVDWVLRTGDLMRSFLRAGRADCPRIYRIKDLIDFVAPIWRDVPAPQTWMLYTDFDNRLLLRSVLCDSLGWADTMIARQVLMEAVSMEARHAFLVCFAGVEPLELLPDEQDFLIDLATLLETANVKLLDCLLVGELGFHSLNQSHQMDAVRRACAAQWLHERYLGEEITCTESPVL